MAIKLGWRGEGDDEVGRRQGERGGKPEKPSQGPGTRAGAVVGVGL